MVERCYLIIRLGHCFNTQFRHASVLHENVWERPKAHVWTKKVHAAKNFATFVLWWRQRKTSISVGPIFLTIPSYLTFAVHEKDIMINRTITDYSEVLRAQEDGNETYKTEKEGEWLVETQGLQYYVYFRYDKIQLEWIDKLCARY